MCKNYQIGLQLGPCERMSINELIEKKTKPSYSYTSLFLRKKPLMITISLTELAKHLNIPSPADEIIIQGISTDTRILTPGSLYVAIKGEQFDGHDFIEEALKKGARAALVSKPSSLPIPQLVVDDTILAFGKISQLWRNRFSLPIIGVTGSNGKTTLKNMIASILRASCHNNDFSVLATEGNLNNNIGVPIMLSRLNEQLRYAVIEMGMNHFGEIAYLTQLAQPQVAVINNAAEAHLEGVKDVAGVARAKGEIFSGLPDNGIAILNRDDAHFEYWRGLVKKFITFGLQHPSDISATLKENQHITLHTPKGNIEVNLPLLGKHNVMNALSATAATIALDINLDAIKQGLENVLPAPGRMRQYVHRQGTRIIDDTYNANPFSLQAAVTTLATFSGEKIIVLGDMKELGPDAKQIHFNAGEKIRAAGIDYLFTFGEMSAATTEAFGSNAQHFTNRDNLLTALQPHLKSSVTILVKGSRSMRMEKIVAGLIPERSEHLH